MRSVIKDKQKGNRDSCAGSCPFGIRNMFQIHHVFPGVTHITEKMGVGFTLIEGENRAILFDTGYGFENIQDFLKTITKKPLTVILSHGHHDHILGVRWFEHSFLCREDMNEFTERTGLAQREKVKKQAEENEIPVPADYLTAGINLPEAIRFTEKTGTFESRTEALGGITVNIIHVPGHTPGSIVLYIPEYSLLMTGDNWNPCTWMWFPTSEGADTWRNRMTELIRTIETTYGRQISKIVCSHQPEAHEGRELKDYLDYMTDEKLKEAPAVDMGAPINTHQVVKDEWVLLFDQSKIKC